MAKENSNSLNDYFAILKFGFIVELGILAQRNSKTGKNDGDSRRREFKLLDFYSDSKVRIIYLLFLKKI